MFSSLIPRVRVNYSLIRCIESMFVSESSSKYKEVAEKMLSEYFEGRAVKMTASGRSALYYILCGLPQKKVMLPAYTCPVVAEAVLYARKKIIYVASDGTSFNANDYSGMDSDTIVIATHQFGYPCDIEAISKMCKKSGALLVEDCAAAIGAEYNGHKVGTYGDYAIISFNHSKQLIVPSGGGCIIAKDKEKLDIILHGMSLVFDKQRTKINKRYAFICLLIKNSFFYHLFSSPSETGERTTVAELPLVKDKSYLYQMDEWQAFLLIPQILKIKQLSDKRKYIFDFYDQNINNDKIIKPSRLDGADYSRYVIQLRDEYVKGFSLYCLSRGVDLDYSHSHLTCPKSFEKEHEMASRIFNIPFYANLTIREMRKIVKVINAY